MKIGLIILHADPARGGAERYTVDLAEALRQRGHEARIVSTSFAANHDASLNVHIDTGGGSRSRRYLRFLQRVEEHLARERYDVVHAMLPVRRCDIYHPHAGLAVEAVTNGHRKREGAILQALSRVATRLNRRRQLFAKVERKLLMEPNGPLILCLSDYVKRTVRMHYPFEEARLPVLINAVDLARFDPAANPVARAVVRQQYGLSDETTVFLMMAQDFARKGLSPAVRAMKGLSDHDAKLLVVGRDDAAPYERLARQLGISDRVIFAGPTPDSYPFYQAADAFVLPTRDDPCSLVVLEALAMGLPVISTARNGATELMTEGIHGFVLRDPGDDVALLQAMQHLLDPLRRQTMAHACIELRPRLAYETHIQHLLAIYQRILTQRSDRHEPGVL